MKSKLIICIALFGIACQTSSLVCPSPELVKLRKMRAHRMKYLSVKRKEALASNYDYFKESAYKAKSLLKIEEWDCPKPGLKHDKMVQKKTRDLQRRYARNLKKVARSTEERTVTVIGNNDN